MEYAYVKKSEWETMKARLRNIKIKFSKLAKKAAVQPFGSGASAGINITLPKASGGGGQTSYLCKVSSVADDGESYGVSLHNSKTEVAVGSGTMMLSMCHPSERLKIGDWAVGNAATITDIVVADEEEDEEE